MLAHNTNFQRTEDYALLKKALGNLTPSAHQIAEFCRFNPGWDWDNFPIDPQIFPKHPQIQYCVSDNVAYELQKLVIDSDRNSVEHCFLLNGMEYVTKSQEGLGGFCPLLFYPKIHSNRGQAISTSLSPQNQGIRDYYNSQPGQLIMLGHTHPNYGNTRKCFSISDILYGVTNIIWLRQKAPQPSEKVIFAIAYTGDNGVCRLVPLMYDPTIQQKGGSAIFRLT